MILYYTGTGNSRYAAELLGHQLNDTVRDCTPLYARRHHAPVPFRNAMGICLPHLCLADPSYFCGFSDPMPFFRQQAGILCNDLRR